MSVHVSADSDVNVSLMRLLNSNADNADLDQSIRWEATGDYPASRHVDTCVGSFATGPIPASASAAGDWTLGALVWSGNVSVTGRQSVVDVSGATSLNLAVLDGSPTLSYLNAGGEESWSIKSPERLLARSWYLLVGIVTGRQARVEAHPLDASYGGSSSDTTIIEPLDLTCDVLTVAAGRPRGVTTSGTLPIGVAENLADLKIEAPFVATEALSAGHIASLVAGAAVQTTVPSLLAAYDFSLRAGDDHHQARPLAPGQEPGILVNHPARGITGSRYSGAPISFADAPDEYAAIHFHSHDLVDSGWPVLLRAQLPDLASGVYGIRVQNKDGEDIVPFVVAPSPTSARNKIAVILPVFSYLAYANEVMYANLDPKPLTDGEVTISEVDTARLGDRSYGLSLYDLHPDGT
ncbi:MAG: N,N-dimethylformamidase beta subunit family domain-containing protein, partial [Pseudonocardiaceae bacterium]